MRALYVEHLEYHANDMTELRRIAETDPELARVIVASNSEANRLADGSFRLGLIVSAFLALAAIIGFVAIVIYVGWWQSIAFLVLLLAVGHLLRVVLTGEWSDTSWLAGFLNRKPSDD